MAVGRGFQGPKFEFESQFVELPLDFMQKQLDSAQKRQDESKTLQLDLLGKKIPVNQYDIAGIDVAKQKKAEIDASLNELSGADFNAPGNIQKLLKTKKEINKIFSQFDLAERLAQRDATITSGLKKLEDENLKLPSYVKDYKSALIKNIAGTTPVEEDIRGTGVTRHVPAVKTVEDYTAGTAADTIERESGLKYEKTDPTLWKVIKEKRQSITPTKLLTSAYNKLSADFEFQASIQQEAEALAGGNREKAAILGGDPFVRDEKGNVKEDKYGNPILTESILGNAFAGVLNKAYSDTSTTNKWLQNAEGKKKLDAAYDKSNELLKTYSEPGTIKFNQIGKSIGDIDASINKAATSGDKFAAQGLINTKSRLLEAFMATPEGKKHAEVIANRPVPPNFIPGDIVTAVEGILANKWTPSMSDYMAVELSSSLGRPLPNVRNVLMPTTVEKMQTKQLVDLLMAKSNIKDPTKIQAAQQWANSLYDWQDNKGFDAEEALDKWVVKGEGFEDTVHRLGIDAQKEIGGATANMLKTLDPKDYKLIADDNTKPGDLDINTAQLTGLVKASTHNPNAEIEVSMKDKNGVDHMVRLVPNQKNPSQVFGDFYNEVASKLDVGDEFKKARQFSQFPDNANISDDPNKVYMAKPKPDKTGYVVEKTDGNLSLLEGTWLLGNYAANYPQMLDALQGKLTEEESKEVAKVKDIRKLTGALYDKVENILDNTDYVFTNRNDIFTYYNKLKD